jgi:hypothetical protein
MYANAKMITVETIPGIRGGGRGEKNGGGNSNVIYLIHCKSLCKYYHVPPPSAIIKNK